VTGLEAGATITSPSPSRIVNSRSHQGSLRRRAPLLGDEPIEFSDLKLDPAAHRVTPQRKINLWATEFRLLHFLMTHPDRCIARTAA